MDLEEKIERRNKERPHNDREAQVYENMVFFGIIFLR